MQILVILPSDDLSVKFNQTCRQHLMLHSFQLHTLLFTENQDFVTENTPVLSIMIT